MPIVIEMPRLNDTMAEGTLAVWHVKEGQEIKSGDAICDIETDKATQELQAFEDGTIAKICVDAGATVDTGTPIVVLATPGESVEDAAKVELKKPEAPKAEEEQKTESKTKSSSASKDQPVSTAAGNAAAIGEGLKVSPLARRLADVHSVDLRLVRGTGPGGRIIKRDVLKAKESGSAQLPPPGAKGGVSASHTQVKALEGSLGAKSIPVAKMRTVIAKRLQESKQLVPHFQTVIEVRVDKLMDVRQAVNTRLALSNEKLSVNDFITRAVAVATAQHPAVNSSWNETTIEQHGTVNVGVAISLPEEKGGGLVVASIKGAHEKGIKVISSEISTLAKKAREKGLSLDEMADPTIAISNLGMPQYGVTQFNPIINPPNAVILGIGAALQRPVVEDGELAVGTVMTITLSGDHRVLDGAGAAEFLTTLRGLLENPAALLV